MIRLKATTEGMTATIRAERPDAVKALEGAAADLRRTLEDRGVNLVRLDVGLARGAGDGAAAGRRDDPAQPSAATGTSNRADATDGADSTDDDQRSGPAVRLPAGSLVDVHA